MRFHSILFPSPAQEARAGNCPWLGFRPRRGGDDCKTVTRGNKTFAAVKEDLTPARRSPAFFADTGLDEILDSILPGGDDNALRRVYYALSAGAETVRYRQEIMRALEIPDVADIFQSFCRAVEGAAHTMADGRKVHTPAQRDKYLVDGALAFCGTVGELLEAAAKRELPSVGLGAFVGAVRAYASRPEFKQAEALLLRAADEIEAISFSLRIRKGRVLIGPAVPSGDFARETREDFACMGEGAPEEQAHKIRLFGELALGPLEILIADVLRREYPEAFALLHRAAEAAETIPEPFILAFARELRFYTSFLDTVQALRAKGLPFAYPVFSGGGTVRIDGAYDMELALKQDSVVPNDCRLSAEERVVVVTGANHSGKTTYIRAIGQIAVLAALGLPAPCGRAEIPLFESFFSHFSDAEEGAARGRLKEELGKLKPILAAAGEGSLVLLNEMFSSTTAQDAQTLAARILNTLTDGGARVLCVTHTIGEIPGHMVSMAAQVAPGSHERLFTVVRAPAETHAHADAMMEAYRLTYRDIRERIGHDG